jgi:hypothetical protein
MLVQDDLPYWRQACLSIMELTTRMWGGRYFPIIPTDGDSIEETFWSILEAFDPDYIYKYQPVGQDVEAYDPETFAEHVDQAIDRQTNGEDEMTPERRARTQESFRRFEFGELQVSDTLIADLKNRLNPFHLDERIINRIKGQTGGIGYPLTDVTEIASPADCQDVVLHDFSAFSPEIQLMAASAMGRSSGTLRQSLIEIGVEVEEQVISPTDLDTLVRGAWEDGERNSTLLHSLTNLHCSPAYRSSIGRHEEPTVVVCGSSLHDYCLYQSLFSVKAHVYWWPNSMLDEAETDDRGDEEKVMWRLRWQLSNQVWSPTGAFQQIVGDEVRLLSRSCDSDALETVGQQIESEIMLPPSQGEFSEHLNISDRIDDLLQYRREVFESENFDHRSIMQFDGGVSVDRVETPKPKQFEEVSLPDHRWITDLEIQNYHLPPVAQLGPDTLDIHWYDTNSARVTRRGFSYFCPNHTYLGGQTLDQILARPKIHLQAPLDLFRMLFEQAGYSIRPSDKGDFQNQAQSRVGGFETLYNLLSRDELRSLFERYVETGESTEKGEIVHLVGTGRSYISFRGIEEEAGEERAAVDLIDELIELGVLRRGIILQCQYCRAADWYDLADLSQQFTCRRCRHQQRIQFPHWKRPSQGPEWYFELDEIMYQFYRHNTHVTVLALGVLKGDAESFIYVPELEIFREGSSGNPETEIDICAIVDGKVIIGEASISADKNRADFDTYMSLADDLGTGTIVFATLADEWSKDLIEHGIEQCRETDRTVKFLTRSDLLD